jgi:hypothetical protein
MGDNVKGFSTLHVGHHKYSLRTKIKSPPGAALRASPQVLAEYVTPHSKIYCKKVKMCRFSSGNWFLCTKFVEFAVAGKRSNTIVDLQKV